jgi:hypothetical protein
LFVCFLQYWSLHLGPTLWVIPPALFCEGFFRDRFSWTTVLLISAS